MEKLPQNLSEEQKQEIIRKLQEKGVKTKCPMCDHDNFIIADGYFANIVQKKPVGAIVLAGQTIPTIPIICAKCGFISQHAIGILGLIKREEERNNDK